MERKNQNLEFSQKFNTKSEDCLERRQHKLYAMVRPVCASGGDIASPEMHCSTKNLNYQDMPKKTNPSEEDDDEYDQEEQEQSGDSVQTKLSRQVLKKVHSTASSSVDTNAKLSVTIKRRSSATTPNGSVSKHSEMGTKLKAELSKYKQELKAYNNTTKDLEEKYMKINYELNEMQQKHDRFVANRKKSRPKDIYSDSSSSTSSSASEYALKRKYTQVFHRGSSFITMLPDGSHSSLDNLHASPYAKPISQNINAPSSRKKRKQQTQKSSPQLTEFSPMNNSCHATPHKRHSKRKLDANKENEPPPNRDMSVVQMVASQYVPNNQATGLKDFYKVLKNVMDTNQNNMASKEVDLKGLQATVSKLQSEQLQFRNIIQQQQSCLQDYHSRCVKAQHIMQTQQLEIDKLNSNNHQLESEISDGIDQLRMKIDSKLRDVAQLPQLMREEQNKYEKIAKENNLLTDRMRSLQGEASQLKIKIEELGRRKSLTINRLKSAERDLKIFKNYNTALKHEKRKLNDELQKIKEQLDTVQSSSKRTVARQREQNEKQRRDLQKRVFELELKLSRSQNSTTSLIQERDSLIAELQTQLNTLVHNFEVSQKHIRVLRRHIYTMSGGSGPNHSRVLNETI